jgi:hypothetical protein
MMAMGDVTEALEGFPDLQKKANAVWDAATELADELHEAVEVRSGLHGSTAFPKPSH